MSAVLDIDDLTVHYGENATRMRAVDGVSLSVSAGETLALVGESGCGKSTVARAVLGLVKPTSGTVRFQGTVLPLLGDAGRRPFLRKIQMIFQDPDASLNPRLTVGASVGEPLEIAEPKLGRGERADRVAALMTSVGLDPTLAGRYPHELSGGQRQRVCIARCLAVRPELIVCDEAVSALDVSIQAQILNLLAELRETHGLSYLFITHDLRVVRYLSTRVAVMYLGQIVELGTTAGVFDAPTHPYTRALLGAVPSLSGSRPHPRARGDVPSAANPPPGCRFHTRCPLVFDRCRREAPALYSILSSNERKTDARASRCFLNERSDGGGAPTHDG